MAATKHLPSAIILHLAATLYCQATLILGVPNQEGMLLISDRLAQEIPAGGKHEVAKIIMLNSNAAVAVAGLGTLIAKPDTTNFLTRCLDTRDLANTFFSTNSVDKFNAGLFARYFDEQFTKFLTSAGFELPIETATAKIVLFVTTPARRCVTYVTVIKVERENDSRVRVSSTCQKRAQPEYAPAQPLPIGCADLFLELRQGHDHRFDDLLKDPVIATFFPKPPAIRNLKLSEAQAFARKLMAESAAKISLLNSNPNVTIGTNLDEIILRFPPPESGH